jgi:hypothetical protein
MYDFGNMFPVIGNKDGITGEGKGMIETVGEFRIAAFSVSLAGHLYGCNSDNGIGHDNGKNVRPAEFFDELQMGRHLVEVIEVAAKNLGDLINCQAWYDDFNVTGDRILDDFSCLVTQGAVVNDFEKTLASSTYLRIEFIFRLHSFCLPDFSQRGHRSNVHVDHRQGMQCLQQFFPPGSNIVLFWR